MLIVKAYGVSFVLKDKSERFVLPEKHVMLHDEWSEDWPKCSILFGEIVETGEPIDVDARARDYFGTKYQPMRGEFTRPPLDLDQWKEIGEVTRIYYFRTGLRVPPPGYMTHPFKTKMRSITRPKTWLFPEDVRTVLYSYRGQRFFRLEMPEGCTVNWRGFVNP